MNKILWTLSWILMIGGGLSLGGSLMTKFRHENRQKFKGKATATVVDIVADVPDKRGKAAGIHDYYYAVFAYYAQGILVKVRCPIGGNPCPFTLNQKVEIKYDLRKPIDFQIYKRTWMNYISAVLYGGGFLCIVSGGVLFLLCALRIL